MDRDAIFGLLRSAKLELTARGVQSLAVFGSVARDTALPNSDLDLLVVFSRPVGLFEFVR
jgi:predicted nucleotidyltransferase